jgi:uncharacterized protein
VFRKSTQPRFPSGIWRGFEVGPSELQKFLGNGASSKVAEALKGIGYSHVTLDLEGYRRGSVNEVFKKATSR